MKFPRLFALARRFEPVFDRVKLNAFTNVRSWQPVVDAAGTVAKDRETPASDDVGCEVTSKVGGTMPACVKWSQDSGAPAPGPPNRRLLPLVKGRFTRLRNLVAACVRCNRARALGLLPQQTGADRMTTAGLRSARRFGQRRRSAATSPSRLGG